MNNSTEGENHSEKETRSDLNILQRYLEMINEGDIELSALRLQAYTKYLEVTVGKFVAHALDRLAWISRIMFRERHAKVFVGSRACADNHYVIAEKCPVCPIFGDFGERRLRVR